MRKDLLELLKQKAAISEENYLDRYHLKQISMNLFDKPYKGIDSRANSIRSSVAMIYNTTIFVKTSEFYRRTGTVMKKPTIFFLSSCTPKQFPQAEYYQAYEALISENYTQEATKQFARLSSKYSVYPEIWYHCCMEMGDYDTAITAFNKTDDLYENSILYDDKLGLP